MASLSSAESRRIATSSADAIIDGAERRSELDEARACRSNREVVLAPVRPVHRAVRLIGPIESHPVDRGIDTRERHLDAQALGVDAGNAVASALGMRSGGEASPEVRSSGVASRPLHDTAAIATRATRRTHRSYQRSGW